MPTGLCLATLPQPASSPTTSICFSPSSSHLLASSLDSTLRLWDVGLARVVKTYRPEKEQGGNAEAAAGGENGEGGGGGRAYQNEKFAIKASFLIVGEEDGSGRRTRRRQRSGGPRPRTYVVTGSEDCRVYFWDVQTRRQAAVLGGHHRDVVSAVAVHPNKPILASAALDHDLAIKVYLDAARSGAPPPPRREETGVVAAVEGEAATADVAEPAATTMTAAGEADEPMAPAADDAAATSQTTNTQ